MEFEEFREDIIEKAKKIQIVLQEEQIEQLWEYMHLLLNWNEKINLTAITEPREIILKHFIDSFTISKYIAEKTSLIDVGTGAGFPGIPLKIIRPDIDIVLIDSLQKRINFLQETIQKIKLENIKAIHARIEEIGKDKKYREKFDYVTSRALANLSVLAEYMLPLSKKCGKVICMKGSNVDEELNDAKCAINILGGKVEKIEKFVLPDSEIGRNIIIIDKIENTPNKYPRKPGMPSKQPIS